MIISSNYNKVAYQISALLLMTVILFVFTELSFLAISGALLTFYIFINLLTGFGNGIPVHLVISFIAAIQWIIGPILSYYSGINHPFYKMHVTEDIYFSFIIPGVLLLHLGLLLPLIGLKNVPKDSISKLEESTTTKIRGAYYLISIGFLSGIVAVFVPPFLYFFLYLLSNLKYIGAFYIYLSNRRSHLVLYIVALSLLLDVLASAIFHDLLLWVLFFGFIYTIRNYVSMRKKLLLVITAFFFMMVLQAVKYQYRNIAWSNASLASFARTELFTSMIISTLQSPGDLFEAKKNELTITRLNQGWIIARVMNYVPNIEPYAGGETINNALTAALLPRFIAESKATAGGRENMLRFTGIELQEGTSMNISIIGEAYANYGRDSGIMFMFIVGLIYSLVLRFILVRSIHKPTLLLWIPFLFLQVIKAETDFITTLNYLIKASIAMAIIFWTFRKILKVEI
jgi:hypothetical protein